MSASRADTQNGAENPEWLVTDGRGAFAMGSAAGARTRKYHGFYMGIPGRAETAFLVDFELKLNGQSIWPHQYESPEGAVISPDPLRAATAFAYEAISSGPRWRWDFPEGKLVFSVEGLQSGGIRLAWKWQGAARKPALLEIRPFWAMRPLHGMGGEAWEIEFARPRAGSPLRVATVTSQSGSDASEVACFQMEGQFDWKSEPLWYRQFHYAEEAARGYLAKEDLFSAGVFAIDLKKAAGGLAAWTVAESPDVFRESPEASGRPKTRLKAPALDFVLHDPPGIVAGFPWFGEWGRDTFISLPGIAMAWIQAGGDRDEVWEWAQGILNRWGEWIRMTGMIPNLIEKGGSHQWESADGTLWWTHALASLWTFSLGDAKLFPGIEDKYRDLLSAAVSSIGAGRHLFLAPSEGGLLEVTEPHSTWMDARIEGAAVTPRMGRLPEINALWFQARCLQWIWSGSAEKAAELEGIERLGRQALACREADRPNMVFLHSLPLAPSFVLKDGKTMEAHLKEIAETLWTPAGLRTLSPRNPAYRPRCIGDQCARDQAYHQGPPWAWLGGHYEMARNRSSGLRRGAIDDATELKLGARALQGTISGHVPEIFDAEAPYSPRGAPAQAWSLACFEEAAARRKGRVDAKLTKILARRWLDQMDKTTDRTEALA